jgi:hypothetical protein
MVLVRLVFGVWPDILAGLVILDAEAGDLGSAKSRGRLMGEAENLCIGRIQSGITISTCLDLKLADSPAYLRSGEGKSEKLGDSLDMTVEVLEELSPTESHGLSGATIGT